MAARATQVGLGRNFGATDVTGTALVDVAPSDQTEIGFELKLPDGPGKGVRFAILEAARPSARVW